MKIIVNADDMGYTKGVSEGIVEGYKKGIISSTTVMCNMPYAEKTPKLLEECEGLGIGVHLTLTCGQPLTKPATLTDKNGYFMKYRKFYAGKVDAKEVYEEFRMQIEKFIDLFHFPPTHMDSHQGVHDSVSILLKEHPELKKNHNVQEIYEVSLELAKEYKLPLRRSCQYQWIDGYHGKNATSNTFIELLEQNKGKDLEFMVHPGYCDLELYTKSSYNIERLQELAGLCDNVVAEYIKENHIEVVHF